VIWERIENIYILRDDEGGISYMAACCEGGGEDECLCRLAATTAAPT